MINEKDKLEYILENNSHKTSQNTRLIVNQQEKEKSFYLVGFAFSADHKVESKKEVQHQTRTSKEIKTEKMKKDSDTN